MEHILSRYRLSNSEWWEWIDIMCRNKVVSNEMLELLIGRVVQITADEGVELEVIKKVSKNRSRRCIIQ